MQFTDTFFLFFFLPGLLVLYHLSKNSLQPYILLVASLIFYACGAKEYFFLFVAATAFNVLIGYAIGRCSKKYGKSRIILLAFGIAINVGVLFYYKYADFVLGSFWRWKGAEYLSRGIALPLGISFFVFKAISYLIDVYTEQIENPSSPIYAALYLTLFTQISSGPLARAATVLPTPHGGGKIAWNKFCDGMSRFVTGVCKKVLLSNPLYGIVEEVYSSNAGDLTTAQAWMGSICFSLQLFYDFAGYSDMAIGLTMMFGYDCPENFLYPYTTRSISEFWRKWHVTLGAWFRDYIYIPLGGSRVDKNWKLYRNLFIVWLLTGLWHGANWTFVIWGLAYFVLIAVEKATGLPKRFSSPVAAFLYRIITLFIINILWVVFRADNIQTALIFIGRMFSYHADSMINARVQFLIKDNFVFLIFALLFTVPIIPWIRSKCQKYRATNVIYQCFFVVASIFLFFWAVSYVVAGANDPFVYANF